MSQKPRSPRSPGTPTSGGRRKFLREDLAHPDAPEPNPLLMQLWVIAGRFRKYGRDLAAIAVLVFALVSLLGVTSLSSGTVLDAWSGLLRSWFGWGAFIVPVSLAWAGWQLLRRDLGRPLPTAWGRVIAAEGAAFALLALFDRANLGSVALAASGQGGGLVGWTLGLLFRRLLPPPADLFVLGLVFLTCLFLAFDVTASRLTRLGERLQAQAGLPASPASAPPPAEKAEPPLATTRVLLPERRLKPKLSAAERMRVPIEAAVEVRTRPAKRDSQLPNLDLLDNSDLRRPAQKEIDETAAVIVKTLREFGVPVSVVGAKVGPSVTQYQVEPGFVEKAGLDGGSRQWKVRVSQISALADDLALALSASTLRIEAPVPGQSYVGVEVPHRRTSLVSLRPVIESEAFQRLNAPLAIALGRDVSGAPVAADLGAMPHLLIAGTTGSGKSVCIISLITCLVANNTPEDLRLVLIDPKMVELVRFNGLLHLYGKVETELDRIIGVLRWVVKEMDRRYKLFEQQAARNLDAYNKKTGRRKDAERLPRIVVVIDELADLMLQAPDETERTLVRLAQMARATGIHLAVATQRPSTDIVTGLIKANFPARISFAVASGVDSRVILDTPGAESLLGRGDMLFLSPEMGTPVRLQGCFVSDKEVDRMVSYWRSQAEDMAPPPPVVEVDDDSQEVAEASEARADLAPWDIMLAREAVVEDKDTQIEQAIGIVKKYGTASASLLQRKMRIGYPRAARLMDELKEMGIIGRERTGGKTREVFIEEDDDPIGDRAAQRLGEGEEDEADE